MARLYRSLFLLHLLLQAFVQQGNDLVEVAHHAEVGLVAVIPKYVVSPIGC